MRSHGICAALISVVLFFGATVAWTSHAQTQNVKICGAGIVNRSDIDATPFLQECFKTSARIIELIPGKYFLNTTLDLGTHPNRIFRTQGVTSGPPCLAKGAKTCAVLIASPTNASDALVTSLGATGLTLRYIAIDGNIGPRRALQGDSVWSKQLGYNLTVHKCESCQFFGMASVRAVKGTAFEFDGDNAFFENILIRDNGWDLQSSHDRSNYRFADGLTVWSSKNLTILNSVFMNNTDIDLIIGNAPGAIIKNNVIGNSHSYAFAALMLDNFNNASAGEFTSARIENNRIDCGDGFCGIGINVGPHMWYPSKPVSGGRIAQNQVHGARQGILTNGALHIEIQQNQISPLKTYISKDCKTQSISWSKGDIVSFKENSAHPTSSQLEKCLPQGLAFSFFSPPGTDVEVSKLYREVLNRNPDDEGGKSLTRRYYQGASLKALREFMANSQESRNNLKKMSRRWLKREIEPKSEQLWIQYLAEGNTLAQLKVALQLTAQ